VVNKPLPFAVRDMLARELAAPDGAVAALGVFRDRMRRSVPSLVRRIARTASPDSRSLLMAAMTLFSSRVIAAFATRSRCSADTYEIAPCRRASVAFSGVRPNNARALRFELAGADRRRRLGYARALPGVMPRLWREPKLDVLFGREPSEVGKGCALQKSRLAGC
jgi:hypothetical protein